MAPDPLWVLILMFLMGVFGLVALAFASVESERDALTPPPRRIEEEPERIIRLEWRRTPLIENGKMLEDWWTAESPFGNYVVNDRGIDSSLQAPQASGRGGGVEVTFYLSAEDARENAELYVNRRLRDEGYPGRTDS